MINKQEVLDRLKDPQEYYSGEGKNYISNSHISQLMTDPAAYGLESDPIEAPQLVIGSYFHDLMEDHINGTKIVDRYEVTDEFREAIAFKQNLLTRDEVELCHKMRNSILNNKSVQMLLSDVNIGVEVPMIGEIDGTPWKAKADAINYSRNLIIDWKTTAKSVDSFDKYGFAGYNYDSAYYVYKELAHQTFGEEFDMVFVVVSKKDAKVRIYFPDTNRWWDGKKKVDQAVFNYKTFVRR